MGSRLAHVIGRFWASVGIALIALVLLEGFARAGIWWNHRGSVPADLREERRFPSDSGVVSPWARTYHKELASLRTEWRPYVYWRTKPFHGEYVTVDEHGRRRTWRQPGTPPSGDPLTIFMFGGSTLWGWGARDEFTIPSLVAKKLTKRIGRPVDVVNFGEIGYVSTQEVIALMIELRAKHVPEVVIFYDGVNDIIAAQSGVPGITMNERNRVAEFNLRGRLNWRGFVKNLALYEVTRWVLRMVNPSPAQDIGAKKEHALAQSVVEQWVENARHVEALARDYGFRALFFLQPTIFSKEQLSPRERRLYEYEEEHGGRAGPFFAEVYASFERTLRAARRQHIFDLSEVFKQHTGTVFIDRWHVTEEGNSYVAAAMVRALERVLGGIGTPVSSGDRN